MVKTFQTWTDVEHWLASRGLFHMELGLERMEKALGSLRPALPQAIQVLGTNGKGSTSAFLASLAQAHGEKCGLFLSPHFISPRERIIINGQPADEELLTEAASIVFGLVQELDLTYFEFLTLVAALVFSEEKVDLAVWEAGLGGRNDATSALGARLHCFTPIAMDHAGIIGPGIKEITLDKAAVIKQHDVAFSALQFPIVEQLLQERASQEHAPLQFIAPFTERACPALGLQGRHQLQNSALALAAWRAISHMDNPEREQAGLKKAFLPGRLQEVQQVRGIARVILDGAHNPHGQLALVDYFKTSSPPGAIIWSCLADKDWQNAFAILLKHFPEAQVIMLPLANARAATFDQVSQFYASLDRSQPLLGAKTLKKALKLAARHAKGSPVLVTGSLYLLAEFYSLFPECLNPQ